MPPDDRATDRTTLRGQPTAIDPASFPVSGTATVGAELSDWWLRLAESEVGAVVPKAVEYSAADLEIMGYVLTRFPPVVPADLPSHSDAALAERGAELSCAFYALGKIARAFGAYAEGRRPSDDCWHDLGVYVRMIQRIRESGGWPS